MKDLVDIPKRARADLKIIPVEHIDQVLEIALYPNRSCRRPVCAAARKTGRDRKTTSE